MDYESLTFGQQNRNFSYDDFQLLKKLIRLSKKHQQQGINDCNGTGCVKGQIYYSGQIDDYAKNRYGFSVKSAYINGDLSIFEQEQSRIEDKINTLIKGTRFKVEYQGDPRGYTVRLRYNKTSIEY